MTGARKTAFYSRHYVNTHVDSLEAKRMMDRILMRGLFRLKFYSGR